MQLHAFSRISICFTLVFWLADVRCVLSSILLQPHRPPPAKYGFSQYGLNKRVSGKGNIFFIFHEFVGLLKCLFFVCSAAQIDAWTPGSETNVWEHSGLFEGDIMLYSDNRNGLVNTSRRWPNATIPFHIDDSFTDVEVLTILGAMQEYHNKTCVRFRPYRENDTNWIDIQSDQGRCSSSVGMRDAGQVLNLYSPNCVTHGVTAHELMHAAGFHHQHSTHDRDEFVEIVWENVLSGHEHNFKKYSTKRVTDFNVTYDYDSIMHYSRKAFTKNGDITIRSLVSEFHSNCVQKFSEFCVHFEGSERDDWATYGAEREGCNEAELDVRARVQHGFRRCSGLRQSEPERNGRNGRNGRNERRSLRDHHQMDLGIFPLLGKNRSCFGF